MGLKVKPAFVLISLTIVCLLQMTHGKDEGGEEETNLASRRGARPAPIMENAVAAAAGKKTASQHQATAKKQANKQPAAKPAKNTKTRKGKAKKAKHSQQVNADNVQPTDKANEPIQQSVQGPLSDPSQPDRLSIFAQDPNQQGDSPPAPLPPLDPIVAPPPDLTGGMGGPPPFGDNGPQEFPRFPNDREENESNRPNRGRNGRGGGEPGSSSEEKNGRRA